MGNKYYLSPFNFSVLSLTIFYLPYYHSQIILLKQLAVTLASFHATNLCPQKPPGLIYIQAYLETDWNFHMVMVTNPQSTFYEIFLHL